MERKEVTGAVFLDVAAAFDTVWHAGLIHKMISSKINSNIVRLVYSYLQKRSFYVKHGGTKSTTRGIRAGFPQRSLLGPELFLIYTADIPKEPGTHLSIFADDTAVHASARNERFMLTLLQRAVDQIVEWMSRWRLRINESKCVAVRFTRKRNPPERRITVGQTQINWSNEVKYLGLIMDSKLTWKSHITNIKNKFTASKNIVLPLICRRSPLDLRNKLLIYKQFLRPTLTYAALTWCSAAKTHINALEVLQNKYLRMITGARWFVRNNQILKDLNIPSIKD